MVLMSSREGWANVILESLACGTPVVASDVGGVREIIRDPVAGMIVTERQPESLAAAISRLRAALPSRVATRRYAEAFGWEPVASANARLLTAASRSTQPMKNVASDFTVHGPQSPT
jgi:glycosyltransferase involved in cell wall biosynthesis